MNPLRGGWLIPLTLLAAMILGVAHLPPGLPQWVGLLRPDWAVALFFFWSIAAHGRTGIFAAWLAGFFFDAISGVTHPFGLHGLSFALATFVGTRLHDRLRMYSLVQQTLVLLAIVVVTHVIKALLRTTVDEVTTLEMLPLPALTTALAFPLIAWVLTPLAERYMSR